MGFENLRAAINKQFGEGAMISMADAAQADQELLSTGVLQIDQVLGGGIPFGRIIEIFGPESSGKTMLASTIVASAQKEGLECLYVDTEHALDKHYMRDVIGVNVDSLFISQPSSSEEALGIISTIVKGVERSVIVLDSVAALAPRAELNGDVGDAHVGLVARQLGQFFRMANAEIAKNDNILIMINQVREKIGGMGYGPSTTTPGGRALKFYASQRMDLRRIGTIAGTGQAVVGQKTKLKVVKNKVAPPQGEVTVDILFNRGFSAEAGIATLALDLKILRQSGAWIKDPNTGETLAQGKLKLIELLETDETFKDKLIKKIKQAQG
jgi:recombination protein RecA